MCDCHSYNMDEPATGTPEVILIKPDWWESEKRKVSIDACIAGHIRALWDARIVTHSCCCGHNNRAPRHVMVEPAQSLEAKAIMQTFDEPLPVMYWVKAVA